VVADDGSPEPPDPAALAGPVPVRVVTQDDRGFRAAAARNRGAAQVEGDVLVFLDADTVPGPGFVAALT
ncbi:glycosyltransferase, partial [Pseudonocardia sp. SID8383]